MSSDAEDGKRTILLMEANPDDTPQLRLNEEIRVITDACQRGKRRAEFRLVVRTSVTERHLRWAILDCKPQVIHICGHGCAAKGLVLESETTSTTQLVSTAALTDTFRLAARYLECVVLNVCYSELQAAEVVKHIPYVIGMNSMISDKAALKFAEGFYDSLFAGEAFSDCYEWGVNALQTAGIPEHSTPRLKVKEPQLSQSQVVVGRYCYPHIVEDPFPVGDTGFSAQRAHAQVWQIFDNATHKILFIEQTIANLRSDKDGFVLPYTSEWVFEETEKEGHAENTPGTINTVADIKRVRRIGLDGVTIDTADQDLANRFQAAKLCLPSVFPGGYAQWRVNEKGEMEKTIDYHNGEPPITYIYHNLPEK